MAVPAALSARLVEVPRDAPLGVVGVDHRPSRGKQFFLAEPDVDRERDPGHQHDMVDRRLVVLRWNEAALASRQQLVFLLVAAIACSARLADEHSTLGAAANIGGNRVALDPLPLGGAGKHRGEAPEVIANCPAGNLVALAALLLELRERRGFDLVEHHSLEGLGQNLHRLQVALGASGPQPREMLVYEAESRFIVGAPRLLAPARVLEALDPLFDANSSGARILASQGGATAGVLGGRPDPRPSRCASRRWGFLVFFFLAAMVMLSWLRPRAMLRTRRGRNSRTCPILKAETRRWS